jgi:glycosyltransferase involved in cell wall biosynthesis
MTNLSLTLIHPTGNPNVRNAATAFANQGLLKEVITTFSYDPEADWAQLLNYLPHPLQKRLTAELERRRWTVPSPAQMQSHPWLEIIRVTLMKANLNAPLGLGKHGLIDWVYTSLDRHVAQHHLTNINAVYAYEDGAATTFTAAKEKGIFCLYDLPIMFYKMAREIQQQEAEQFPELASSLQAVQEPHWRLQRKDQEIQLADHIFVASSITQASLLREGIAPEKISIIPYGAPIEYFQPAPKPDRTFRALFVGQVGARKGVHYLLQAWKKLRLPQAELMLVGFNNFPQHWLDHLPSTVRYIPSVPHPQLNQYYSSANVFVFPSLVEGFGLVLTEAMACGIPIITTPNTAGPDIITNGVEGFIIPIRDPEALQEKIEWCYQHPAELAEMGWAARRKAEQLTWSRYQRQLSDKVMALINLSSILR